MVLENICNDFFLNWQIGFYERQYDTCLELCRSFISEMKSKFKSKILIDNDQDYIHVYYFLILAKGLQSFTNITIETRNKDWVTNEKTIELLWDELWDSKECFENFQNHCLDKNIIKKYLDLLNGLEKFYYDTFGEGLYLSPEILILKSKCNICDKDIRGCNHIMGQFYGGQKCKNIIIDFQIQSISIVPAPYDMRCRLWPWRMNKENRTFEGKFMSLYGVDRFLYED